MRTLVLVAALLHGCSVSPGGVTTGPDGLRVFGWHGPPVLCTAAAAVNPVTGMLRGGQGEPEPVWLEDAAGRRLSVVWPAGFSVRFEPDAVLYDERGMAVVRDGGTVRLGQVNLETAAGTYEDPYIAKGLVFDGCYPSSVGG